jgi:L-Ala-D/L-Glu epimerase
MERDQMSRDPDSKLSLAAARLQLPLTVPYRLVFGDQHHFDVLLVAAIDGDRVGWGEATILPGYTDETIQQGWDLAQQLVASCKTSGSIRRAAGELLHTAPFTATAFLTSLDWLEGHKALRHSGRFDLLGTVNGKADHPEQLEAEIESLLAKGYATLKVKIGWEVEKDLKQVEAVRRIVNGRARLRIDGNQGYKRDQAVEFLTRVKPDDIELVEQPCAAEDWDSAAALAGIGDVPLMLDESIYSLDDIDRAARLKCADFIKLKLMKLGDLDTLDKGLRQIADRGMKAVLGNGVAADIGCWMELCVGLDTVTTAGEMNGFLKTPVQLLIPALRCEGPTVVLSGDLPSVDVEAVTRHASDRAGAWTELTNH